MKKRCFLSWITYLSFWFFLIVAFIITDAYGLFLLCTIFLFFPLISYIILRIQARAIHLHLIKRKEQIWIEVHSHPFFGNPLLQAKFNRYQLFTQDNSTFTISVLKSTPLSFEDEQLGVLKLTLEEIRFYDPLHLFYFRKKQQDTLRFMLVPKPSAMTAAFLQSAMVQKKEGEWIDKHEVREYQPGDSLKWIHHKLSYKTQKIMIRLFENENSETAALFLDLSSSLSECKQCIAFYQSLASFFLQHQIQLKVWYYSQEKLCCLDVQSPKEIEVSLYQILSAPKSTISSLPAKLRLIEHGNYLFDEKGGALHVYQS